MACTSEKPTGTSDPASASPIPHAADVTLTDQTNILPFRKILTVFLGLGLCVFASALDSVVIATSLPALNASLRAGSVVSWVPSAYMLTSSAFQPLYGRFSDVFGRKAALVAGMTVFMVGNLLAGFSKNVGQAIVFRGLAGVGGGGIVSMMQIVVSDIISLRERGKYQGIIQGVVVIGYTVGPPLGATLSEKVGWQWSFWITVPVSFVATLIVWFVLPLKPVEPGMRRKLMSIDYLGTVLTLVACTLIMLPLIWGGVTYPWTSPIVLGTLFPGILSIGLFCLWEWKGARLPIVPMYIFKHLTVSGVYIVMFINGFVFFSTLYCLPQYFQIVLGYESINASMFLIPFLVAQVFASWASGMAISKTGRYTPLLNTGFALWAIGCGCISMVGENTSKPAMIIFMLLSGIGAGQTLQPATIAAQASVPRRDMSVVTAFRNFVKSLGGTFSLAVNAAISNNRLRDAMERIYLPEEIISMIVDEPSSMFSEDIDIPDETRAHIMHHGFVKGFKYIFYLNAALTASAVIISYMMIKHKDLNVDFEERVAMKLAQKVDGGSDEELGVATVLVQEHAIAVTSLLDSHPKHEV